MNGYLALARRHENPLREAVTNGLLTLLSLSVVASALQYAMDLPTRFMPTAVGAFGLILVLLLALLPRHLPHGRFGAANSVTLARTAMGTLLLGCVGAGAEPVLAWVAVSIATLAAPVWTRLTASWRVARARQALLAPVLTWRPTPA